MNENTENVWIDIDDTIAETWPVMVGFGMNYCKENGLDSRPDFNVESCEDDLYFADILHLRDEQLADFFAENYPNYLTRIDPAHGAREFLLKLKERGYKVNLISSRRDYDGQVEQMTRAWLAENDIPYDTLVVNIKDKASYLVDEKGIFIDDSYGHCDAVNRKTSLYVIQRRTPFSKEATDVLQGCVWPQIFTHILAMERNKIMP